MKLNLYPIKSKNWKGSSRYFYMHNGVIYLFIFSGSFDSKLVFLTTLIYDCCFSYIMFFLCHILKYPLG